MLVAASYVWSNTVGASTKYPVLSTRYAVLSWTTAALGFASSTALRAGIAWTAEAAVALDLCSEYWVLSTGY